MLSRGSMCLACYFHSSCLHLTLGVSLLDVVFPLAQRLRRERGISKTETNKTLQCLSVRVCVFVCVGGAGVSGEEQHLRKNRQRGRSSAWLTRKGSLLTERMQGEEGKE